MNRSLSFIILALFATGLFSATFSNTADDNMRIAQRMLRGEKVTHAEKVAAYPTFRTMRDALRQQQPVQPPSIMRTGGPDDFGYSFKDQAAVGGPTYGWINTTAADSAIGGLAFGDDATVGPIGVNFPFQLYGVSFTQLYLC